MRKTSFKYFLVSNGYGEGELDQTIIYLSEQGLKLLDQLLTAQAKLNLNDITDTTFKSDRDDKPVRSGI